MGAYRVLHWREMGSHPLVELHIIGVGVTQFDERFQDPTEIALDYINRSGGELKGAQVEHYEVAVGRVRRGWRGFVFGHRADTYTTAVSREELLTALKLAAADAFAREDGRV